LLVLSPNQLDGLIKINNKLVPRGLDPQLVFKTAPVKEIHHCQWRHLSKDPKTEEVPVA